MAAAFLAAALFLSVEVKAISAHSGILMDGATGRVMFEKMPDKQSLIASTTKIMTALVVCEQCNVLDRMKIPKEAVGIEGSSMYLKEGEVLTIQDLLYGLMLRSGNDAAVALAIYCAGTVEGFAELMNDKARMLGLSNTHFVKPNGLDAPGHYSTARDLGVLACYAMENPIFAQTVSTKSVTVGDRVLKNHNKLLWQVEGADGVKTGFTKAAGRILVSSATREGRRLVAVTINAPNDWQDHKSLLEEGFTQYTVRDIVEKGQCLGSLQVAGGLSGTVELLADADFSYALTETEEPQIVLPKPGFVYAPVAEGQEAGYAYVCLENNPVGKIPLVYGKTVEQEITPKKSFWQRILGGG
ncbi:MAG: D-alanyl-D-alanine carboxypeptidase [Oscillospiraceae bacterium]|nr:D-alanyl-D-alanine carboxypeptidase [Oscillospiraceae bacterium]